MFKNKTCVLFGLFLMFNFLIDIIKCNQLNLSANGEWKSINTHGDNSLISGYKAANDSLELPFSIVISDNEISQYASNQSEINVSISLDVFGDWQRESILFYINDKLKSSYVIKTPENGWKHSSKQEWSQYGVCISCDTTQNGYSTYMIQQRWTQDINSLFKCFVAIFYPE